MLLGIVFFEDSAEDVDEEVDLKLLENMGLAESDILLSENGEEDELEKNLEGAPTLSSKLISDLPAFKTSSQSIEEPRPP